MYMMYECEYKSIVRERHVKHNYVPSFLFHIEDEKIK
jgi:hypothetical protein